MKNANFTNYHDIMAVFLLCYKKNQYICPEIILL